MPLEAPLLLSLTTLDQGRADAAPPEDRVAAARHRRPARASQTLAGRGLARRLLAEATGVAGPLWRIETDRDGRPAALGPGGAAGPDFSLSHSGGWVACALARRGRVGVDVEVPRPGRAAAAIAAAYLSDGERAAVAAEGEAALLAFWTLREAVAKATGAGVAGALALDGGVLAAARGSALGVELLGARWAVGHRALAGLHLAVAWREGEVAALAAALAQLPGSGGSSQSAT